MTFFNKQKRLQQECEEQAQRMRERAIKTSTRLLIHWLHQHQLTVSLHPLTHRDTWLIQPAEENPTALLHLKEVFHPFNPQLETLGIYPRPDNPVGITGISWEDLTDIWDAAKASGHAMDSPTGRYGLTAARLTSISTAA